MRACQRRRGRPVCAQIGAEGRCWVPRSAGRRAHAAACRHAHAAALTTPTPTPHCPPLATTSGTPGTRASWARSRRCGSRACCRWCRWTSTAPCGARGPCGRRGLGSRALAAAGAVGSVVPCRTQAAPPPAASAAHRSASWGPHCCLPQGGERGAVARLPHDLGRCAERHAARQHVPQAAGGGHRCTLRHQEPGRDGCEAGGWVPGGTRAQHAAGAPGIGAHGPGETARRRRRLPHLPRLRLALGQGWCRPGVVSYRRFDGPIILPYGAASVMNRWAQMYDAMTTDVRCAWSAPACVAGWWWWRRCAGWQSC